MDDTTKVILPILLGGLAGAVVSALNNRFIEKEKRALEFVKDYFAMREKIGKAKGYLQDVNAIIRDPIEAMLLIREVGDRLNSIAYYYIKNILRKDLLEESGVITDMREFLELIDNAQHAFRRVEKEQHPSISQHNLYRAGIWWPHLFNLRAFHLEREED
ncbi:MAG TPA: hypothetical protein VJ842_13030 [Pyrinomonadaceae bacterium]|nr:hypothetical protein [Pyrinomonadaceae bacterium]